MAQTNHPIPADGAAIEAAAKLLAGGGVVAFPTETVYGLGADAFNQAAVARVFAIKERPRFDPLIVHLPDLAAAKQITTAFGPLAERLATAFWPGALTLVLPKQAHVPDLVTAGLDTVAVRVPDHPVALELIRRSGVPLAAPSANRFSRLSPTTAEHVRAELGDQVDMLLDGGPCRAGVESTVVSLADPQAPPTVLRVGGLSLEAISEIAPQIRLATPHPSDGGAAEAGLASPGMLSRHYAPGTALKLVDRADQLQVNRLGTRVGLICLQPGGDWQDSFAVVEILSADGNLSEAAANLFAALRRLDSADLDLIIAQRVPNHGLGRAINDRFERAHK